MASHSAFPASSANVPPLLFEGVSGNGRAWRVGRLKILSLEGGPEEIGCQHGVLAREEALSAAVLPLSRAVAQIDGIKGLPWARRHIAMWYVSRLYARIKRDLADEYVEEIRGLAAGLGLSFETVFRASFLSEVLQSLATQTGLGEEDAVKKGGCTAAVALGERTAVGVLHGKNQDYDAAGSWDNSPTVIITRARGAKAYAKATSAGLLKGNLSLNEAGISIGGHMLFSAKPGRNGRTFTALENDAMRRAHSLGEVVDMFRNGPRIGCFAFVVTDANADDAAVIECDGDEVAVRHAERGVLAMANIFTAAQSVMDKDVLINGGYARNPLSRQLRSDAMLSASKARLEPKDLAAVLADNFDTSSGRVRGLGHTIASIMTVTSAVVRPGAGEMWIGDGRAPVSVGRYIGLGLETAFSGQEPRIIGTLHAGETRSPRLAALRMFIAARRAFEESGDAGLALQLLDEAAAFDPDEPAYHRFICRLHIRDMRLVLAQSAIDRAVTQNSPPNEVAECAILRGHIADLSGNRQQAVAEYRRVFALYDDAAPPVLRVAKALLKIANTCLDRAFSQSDAVNLTVPFSLVSGIE